jgi:organic hydroperoxide reductase OsmC/OhrA
VAAAAQQDGPVTVTSGTLPSLQTAPPPQFGGPGGVWSPETLLCAAIADCFVLTFRVTCRAARFEWQQLECRAEGVLERVGQNSQFTQHKIFARLSIPSGGNVARARELLERAEQGCLIANSLRGTRTLEMEVLAGGAAAEFRAV